MSSPSHRAAAIAVATVTPNAPSPTARERRERLLAESSRELQRALCEADVSQDQLAQATGRSPSIVQRLCDPERHEALAVADVPLAPERVGVAMLQWAAQHRGYSVHKVHAHDTIEDDIDHLAEMNVEDAGLTAEILRAFGDGAFTAAEATKIKTLLRESIERREALIARCDEAVASRVSPLRRAAT